MNTKEHHCKRGINANIKIGLNVNRPGQCVNRKEDQLINRLLV